MDFAAHGLNTEFAADLSKCILFIFPKIFFPRNTDHEPRLVAGLQGWYGLRNVVPRQGTEISIHLFEHRTINFIDNM